MRIIVSPEVLSDIHNEECVIELESYYKSNITENSVNIPYFFKRIMIDEKNNQTNLYELIWSFTGMDDCTYDYVEILQNLQPIFSEKYKRHFIETAKLLLKGLLPTTCEARTDNKFNIQKQRLEKLIEY